MWCPCIIPGYHKGHCLLQLVWDANVLSIIALVFYLVCSVYSKHNDASCIVLFYLHCYALYRNITIHATIWPQWCLNTMIRQHAFIGHFCSAELIGISMPAITPSETQCKLALLIGICYPFSGIIVIMISESFWSVAWLHLIKSTYRYV